MATAAQPTIQQTASSKQSNLWLFSAGTDLSVFLGSALLAMIALVIGARVGVFNSDTPDWTWIPAVLLVDVAHVYSTGFRAYLNKAEFKRRPKLYSIVPVLSFAIGVVLYYLGDMVFWRVLAYLAVFHFVRQQYGWVALYRRKVGETGRLGYWIDTITIYATTVYPLLYWHTHLPRRFWWFVKSDFATLLPLGVDRFIAPLYWSILFVYATKALYQWFILRKPNPGKDIVVITTAACWYLGIVAFNSDYAFTVTNVLIHGIPYLALIYWYERERLDKTSGGLVKAFFAHGPYLFLATLWFCAYAEELVWDRAVWHDRSWFFGASWDIDHLKIIMVPLLAVPQITHYVLDGFLWRRRATPELFESK
jgi:hypothetical protein